MAGIPVLAGGRVQVGVEKTGKTVTVPNDYRAKLMFYMNSICSIIPDMQNEPGFRRIRDYRNYELDQDEEENLLHFCLSLSPHLLDDKCIFKTDGEDSKNEFYELTAAHTRFVAVNRIVIAGQQKKVQKIMTYTHCWMHRYYYDPIRIITDTHEAKIKARLPARAHQPVQRGGGGDDWRQQEDAEAQRQELQKYADEKRQREGEAQRQELERYAADKRQREAEDRRQREMDALRRENEEMRREMTEVKDQMQQKDKGCDIM